MFIQNISHEVWGGDSGKYRLKDSENKPVDLAPEDTCIRVAKGLAVNEVDKEKYEELFSKILLEGKFSGGGRIMANIGAGDLKREASPINCTVMGQIPDSMKGIMQSAKEAAITLRVGAGTGYDFSSIRPRDSHVHGAGAKTSGVISFMKIFDATCGTVMGGGERRGAQMGCLDIQHPEIESFITCKREDGMLRYFNLSVLITDNFMQAVVDNDVWHLWFWERVSDKEADSITKEIELSNLQPVTLIKAEDIPFRHPNSELFSFAEDHVEVLNGNCSTRTIFKKRIFRTIMAADLFDKIMKSTYDFAEPGFILIDRVNADNTLGFCEIIRATNPCVTADTRLATQFGMVKIGDLYASGAPLEVTVDNRAMGEKTLGVSTRPAMPVFMTAPYSDVYRVTTEAGYEIKATDWHGLYTTRGRVVLKDLRIGDKLLIQSGKGQFGSDGSAELGTLLGLLAGDGHFTNRGKNQQAAVISLWGDDRDYADQVITYVNAVIAGESERTRDYAVSAVAVPQRNLVTIRSILLAQVLERYDFNAATKMKVPEVIWRGSENCVKGYLRALFQCDGTVQRDDKNAYCTIRLASSVPSLLKEVQQLLGNFGIFSRVLARRKAGQRMMPDGKGGKKLYDCKADYELLIGSQSRDRFMQEIGFISDDKNRKYAEWRTQRSSSRVEHFSSAIKSIEYVGAEAVYDTTQPDKNNLIFNSCVSSNCGEQPLPPNASCLLGSMILSPYVSNMFTPEASFNWKEFEDDVAIATRMLDNVVESNNLPLEEMRDQILSKRRHGLGFTGLGTTFNMMCLPYGGKDSQDFAERISYTIARASLIENINLAKEKGCAPILSTVESRNSVINSGYLSRLLASFDDVVRDSLISDILEYGLRFSHATSIAPTGTLSLTWGNNCSNGIEPSFTNEYARNFRQHGKKTKTQEYVRSLEFHYWKEMYGDAQLPEYWRVTDNLSVEDHINIQSAVQKWVDSAISKTINVPFDYPFEDFKKTYTSGWQKGLKGVTTFRYNPAAFSGVLVRKEDLENTKYVFVLEGNEEITVLGSDTIEYDGELHNAANLFDALKEKMYGDM